LKRSLRLLTLSLCSFVLVIGGFVTNHDTAGAKSYTIVIVTKAETISVFQDVDAGAQVAATHRRRNVGRASNDAPPYGAGRSTALSSSTRPVRLVAEMATASGYRVEIAPIVSLYVNAHNEPARRAYARVGFEEIGTFSTVMF